MMPRLPALLLVIILAGCDSYNLSLDDFIDAHLNVITTELTITSTHVVCYDGYIAVPADNSDVTFEIDIRNPFGYEYTESVGGVAGLSVVRRGDTIYGTVTGLSRGTTVHINSSVTTVEGESYYFNYHDYSRPTFIVRNFEPPPATDLYVNGASVTGFSPGTHSYTATVPFDTRSASVYLEVDYSSYGGWGDSVNIDYMTPGVPVTVTVSANSDTGLKRGDGYTVTVTRELPTNTVYNATDLATRLTSVAASGGTLYVAEDVTAVISSPISFSGNVKISVAPGKTARIINSSASNRFTVASGKTLDLSPEPGGFISLEGQGPSTTAVVSLSGTLNLNSNTAIHGGDNTGNGGGVYISSGGELYIYGGEISGNRAGSGGGVYIDGGMLNMPGGIIYGSNASASGKRNIAAAGQGSSLAKTGGDAKWGNGSQIDAGTAYYLDTTLHGGYPGTADTND